MANIQPSDVIGKKYGYLTITEFLGRDKNSLIKVIAKCKCGVIREYFLGNIKRDRHTKSCGCLKIEKNGDAVRTHGFSGKNTRHPLYRIWGMMIERCEKENNSSYPDYGGKGVTVCELWRNDFKAYYDWCIKNGWRQGLQVDKDKIGTGLLYSPEMCCVITAKENQNNRSNNVVIEYKGERLTLAQASEKYNIKYNLLRMRIVKYKWAVERALLTPLRVSKNKIKSNG